MREGLPGTTSLEASKGQAPPGRHPTPFRERQHISLFNLFLASQGGLDSSSPSRSLQCFLEVLQTGAGHVAGQYSVPSFAVCEDVTEPQWAVMASNHCATHRRAARPLRSVTPKWYQFRDAIKAGGQSAGFSPMLAAQLSGVNDLMPIKLYQQPGRPRLISWLQVSEAKLGLRATEPMMIRRHVLRRPESTAEGEVAWVTVTPHKPPLLPVLVISQQDPGEVG